MGEWQKGHIMKKFIVVLIALTLLTPAFSDIVAYNNYGFDTAPWTYAENSFVYTDNGGTHTSVAPDTYPSANPLFGNVLDLTNNAFGFFYDNGATAIQFYEGTVEMWIAPHWNGTNQGGAGVGPVGSEQDLIVDGAVDHHIVGELGLFIYNVGRPDDGGSVRAMFNYDGADAEDITLWDQSTGTTADWTEGSWHHIAVSWDADTVGLYIDGMVSDEVARTGSPAIKLSKGHYLWGKDTGSGIINCFDGQIDDFAISNHAKYTPVAGGYAVPTEPVIPPKSTQQVWELGFGMDSDFNQDCYINFRDFAILANNNWNFVDLALFVMDWLRSNHPDNPDGEKPWILRSIITDMSRCQPAEAISDVKEKYHWQLIDYEGEGLNGVMLAAASQVDAPDVTLPLGVSGWYAIYIGFWNPHHVYDGSFRIKLKLSDDTSFQAISDPEPGIEWTKVSDLKEAFFKCADLTGRDLVIGQHSKGTPRKASIAYVKLIPLSEQEVIEINNDRADTSKRMLYALNDGNGLFYRGPTTREDLLEEVEQYRYSDVKALILAVSCGDLVNYPSNVGTTWYSDSGDELSPAGWRTVRDSLQTLLAQEIVPVQELSEYMHQMGKECHVMFRLALIGDLPPSHHFQSIAHLRPDLRMISKDGTPMEKISYAYPEVREYMLSMIREVAEGYDIDGVNLCFIRGPQFVGYEDIVVNDFINIYGIDPRELDENDIRAQQHRASYVTEFVRSAHNLMNEISLNKGRKIELSVMVNSGEASQARNLFFGLDVWTWINESLLDSIFISGSADSAIVNALASHNCKLITQTNGNPGVIVGTAKGGFDNGADGFWAWDLNAVQEYPDYWQVYKRIGHEEEIDNFITSIPAMKTIKLNTIGGLDVTNTTNVGANENGYWPPEMLPIYSGG